MEYISNTKTKYGFDLAYELATNPDQASELFGADPIEQDRYLSRFLDKMDSAQEPKARQTATPKLDSVPASRKTKPHISEMSTEEWIKADWKERGIIK